MFEFLRPEAWHTRWARSLFFVLTPIVFGGYLLRGRSSVLYVSLDPFWVSNYPQSSLPGFLAELTAYGYYTGTAAAVLLALICAVQCHRWRTADRTPGPSLVWYLPAFVAGIEAMRHARLLGSRHGFIGHLPTISELRLQAS